MKPSEVGFVRFFARITACHMVTYMIVGVLAYKIMDYPAPRFPSQGRSSASGK